MMIEKRYFGFLVQCIFIQTCFVTGPHLTIRVNVVRQGQVAVGGVALQVDVGLMAASESCG